MIYKDKHSDIHLIGDDNIGIRLSDGYYKTYNKEEILSYKKLNSLVVKNKMDTIYGVYVKDKNNIIYYSRNGTRLINLEKGKLSISIRSGHKYIISRNKPNSIKIEI